MSKAYRSIWSSFTRVPKRQVLDGTLVRELRGNRGQVVAAHHTLVGQTIHACARHSSSAPRGPPKASRWPGTASSFLACRRSMTEEQESSRAGLPASPSVTTTRKTPGQPRPPPDGTKRPAHAKGARRFSVVREEVCLITSVSGAGLQALFGAPEAPRRQVHGLDNERPQSGLRYPLTFTDIDGADAAAVQAA